MECPSGTVEVAVWEETIYFDKVRENTESTNCTAIDDRHPNYLELRRALLPVMALIGPCTVGVCAGVYLLEPETFEEVTKDIP
jgi:ribonuclease PH